MKNWHVAVIAVSVFLLLLGCNLGSSTPSSQTSTSAPTGAPTAPTAAPTSPAGAQPVKVELSWDKPVDMDLEIWNAGGTSLVHRAFGQQTDSIHFKGENCGQDITSGLAGQEYWYFKKTSDEDFTVGEYVISIFFAGMENSGVSEATAHVTVTKPNGQTITRQRLIQWEKGKDQWHAFRINAATGDMVDIDKIIVYTTN